MVFFFLLSSSSDRGALGPAPRSRYASERPDPLKPLEIESRAAVSSVGTTHTFEDSPRASSGSIWRYW